MWDGCGDWQVITTNRWLRSSGGGSSQVGVHGTALLPEQVGVWDREKGRAAQAERAYRFAADVLPIIGDIRAGGITSLNGVAEELNRRGVGTPRGGRWAAMTVRRVVERASGTAKG